MFYYDPQTPHLEVITIIVYPRIYIEYAKKLFEHPTTTIMSNEFIKEWSIFFVSFD